MQSVLKECIHLWRWLVSRKGLLLIVGILIWISITSIRVDQYLIGWDNYSAYLGGMDGLFRTIFSTWRSYRGIGVSGDSESVDVFRQLIILLLSPFVSEPLRDQMYILGCVWIGVLSIYVLVSRFMRRLGTHENFIDVIATISASVYLFNLNTLATFYFPIITYITRFAALPLLVLAFDIFIRSKKITWRVMLLFILVNLFASGSYITATVFLTTLVLLGTFVAFQGSWNRGIVALLLFVAIQSYWMVPFVNYTVQKSESLRLAPVFVDTNEAQLNLKADAYSVKNQLIVYPNFFATRFQTATNPASMRAFHPITDALQNRLMQSVLYIFPVFAILGSLFIVMNRKRYRSMVWVPIMYTFYVLVSSQEYSWFGFIPAFLNRYIPYFQVIFRFGDTKFHPYIILSGAVAVGVLMHELYLFVAKKRIQTGILSIVLALLSIGLPMTTVFRSYFTNEFLPSFLFVKIPESYKQIAATINSSDKEGRVLHLPYDPTLYWRSYSWGYLGSAFFQDVLRVPYIDKTFEPASLETTDVFTRLSALIQDASDASVDGKLSLAKKISRLLTEYGIRWVVMDTSVSSNVAIKNAVYWGQYNREDSDSLLSTLQEIGAIEEISKKGALTLFEVKEVVSLISSASNASSLDPSLTHVSTNEILFPYLQVEKSSNSILYPLLYKDSTAVIEKGGISFNHTVSQELRGKKGTFELENANDDQKLIHVTLVYKNGSATIDLREVLSPTIQGNVVQREIQSIPFPVSAFDKLSEIFSDASLYRSNWHVLAYNSYSPIRLAVDGIVLPVPTIVSDGEYELGTVLVSSNEILFSFFVADKQVQIPPSRLTFTDTPNCFGDRVDGYAYSYKTGTVTTQNGTSCLITRVSDRQSPYIEVSLAYSAQAVDGDDEITLLESAKPTVAKEIRSLGKPTQLSFCIQDASFDTCANFHTVSQLEKAGQLIIPTERVLYEGGDRALRLAVMTQGKQEVAVSVNNLSLQSFHRVSQSMVVIPNESVKSPEIALDSNIVHVQIPYIFSTGSYYSEVGKDGFGLTNQPCQTYGADRTVRKAGNSYLSYVANCYAELSTSIPFSHRTTKLWVASYVLYSGKYPKFILKDALLSYVDSYLSFDQGYPNILGNLTLESPEQWFHRYSPEYIQSQFIGGTPSTTYTLIPARTEIEDSRIKNYTIHQNSPNEGIFRLDSQDIVELPQSWEKMQIHVGNPEKTYGIPDGIQRTKILPSLWKISISGLTDSPMLLRQNEGFDHQWRAYSSIFSALVGVGESIKSIKCNGFANCYEIKENGTYYLLYTPERLAVLGWFMTFTAIAVCLVTARARE